jgi:hypothetical protein
MTKSKNQGQSDLSLKRFRRWFWRTAGAGSLLTIAAAAAAATAPGNQAVINKFALNAYCSEAQSKSASLANGSVSYKRVADLASNRALVEHPDIYPDSSAWKNAIVALLDQYGDEPTSQLCSENPGPKS